MKLGKEKLRKLYERSRLLFCNVEEAQRILGTDDTDPVKSARTDNGASIKKLLQGMNALGPKIVCITDGPNGAYAYDGHMNEYWFMPIYPDPKPPLNRTGAGDAFASTFTTAIILGKSVHDALRWAPVNSAYVVQGIGAQRGLLTRDILLSYLEKAPANYVPVKL